MIQSYLELAGKNQNEDFKKRSNFLKVFPLFFAENAPDFYEDREMQAIKKGLLDLNIKLNIFELPKTTQACFWYIFFNFMTPIKGEIEITTPRRKILAKKYCRKADPNSRTLQNTFLQLKKSGLLVEVSKEKHTTRYVVPLISATRSFTESYIALQVSYLELLHSAHIKAISKPENNFLDSRKIKQTLRDQMTDEFMEKMSYEKQNLKLKVTYEIECNSESGELIFGDLVDVINVEQTQKNQDDQLQVINRFLSCGYELKKSQINELCKRNIAMLASNYKQDQAGVKRIIKSTPTIGRATYKNLIEFFSSDMTV